MFTHVIDALSKMLIDNSNINEMKNLGKSFLTDFCNDEASIEGVAKMCAAAENAEYEAKIFVIRVSGETIVQNQHLRDKILPIVTPLAIATLAECDDDDESDILRVLEEIDSLTIQELKNLRQSIVNLRFRRSVSFNITLIEIFQKHASKFPLGQFWTEFGIFDESDERFAFNITLIIDDFIKSINDPTKHEWIQQFFNLAIDGILAGAKLDKNAQIMNILALMTLEIKKIPENNLASTVFRIFEKLSSNSTSIVNSFEILNLFDFILSEEDDDKKIQKSLFQKIMAARVDVFVENKVHLEEETFEELKGISKEGSTFKKALVPSKDCMTDEILQVQLISMIESDKDEKFRDLSASMLKNINPENIILLLRLSRKLHIQQYHPVLEIFAKDQGGIESIDSVLDFASSQIGKGDIASWDVQTATTLGFYLAMVTNQLKKDDSGEFAKKVIDFGAAVVNDFIENILLFAQKTIDTADDSPLQLLCSKYFDEQAKVSCRTKMYEAQQWGSYKDTKNIFKFDKFGLDGLLALIKNTENVKKDNVISIGGVGGLFALETAAEMFDEKYNTEKIVKITFQMFCNLITASIEKLQKIEQLKTVSAQNIDALVIAGVKLANSSIFNNLEKYPLKEITRDEKVESLLNELLLGELMKLIDLSLDEGSVARSFVIASHEGIRLVLDQRLLPNKTLVNEETVLKIFQYIVLIANESYGMTCQFLKILLTHRSADVIKTKMKLLTDELLNLLRAESATSTDVSELLEIVNEKCDRKVLENIASELIAQISKGATAHDLKKLVEVANLVQADKEECGSFGEGETTLGYGHIQILREVEKVLETIEKKEKLYPAFEYLTQLSIYLSMDDESRWMSDVVNQFTRGKQDTPRSEKAAKDAKLCTYTQTQREFQSQHWYHCHSCNMVDSVGVCSTCAVVCHEGHNLSYAKHSSFFCDCGAQDRTPGPGRRSCIALTPRSPGVTPGKKQPETATSSGIFNASEEITLSINITNPLIRERCKDVLTKMIPKIEAVCVSLESSSKDEETAEEKAKALLDRFQKTTKATVNNYIKADFQTNQGALENVKPSLSPDGNEAIRKVLLENSIHRNFVGVLEENREKYIVVLQDKNKMSLLALSTLLSRKSNSSTNAVSRQSHYTASFTVMNVLPAPYGRFILQSGIREAIIHRINNGTFGEKISLHLNTPSNDFITQTRWIPQLPGYLAISSTKNVKIFNFLEDPMCPLFNLKVSGQIHDFTYFFVGTELHLLILVLSKDGESVFIKKVTDNDKASDHGEVTILERVQIGKDVLVPKNDLQIYSNGTIFYSFQTGVLFLAYTIGSSKKGTHKKQVFYALSCPVFENNCWSVSTVAKMPELSALMKEMLTQKRSFDKDAKSKDAEGLIKLAPNLSSGSTSSGKYVRNLREATGHPGLLTASYGPHSFAITFTESEINVEFLGDVRPILDISAIVHNFRGTEKPTSSILAIAEDGALRGWTINPAQTEKGEFWKNMALQNTQVPVVQETSKEYPPTFLEDFEIITDSELEYQSNQLQRVYNRQRLRRCLEPGNNTNSHYVTWKGPFTLSVKTAKIVRGLRLHFGDNDAQSAPHSVELTQFNRIVTVGDVTQARWFDIILTPEEALNLDGKITLEFVPSPNADRKIVVDAIRLYKTSRRAIMNEKKRNDTKLAKKSSLFKGPRDDSDSLRWAAVKSYVAGANLVTKASQRSQYLEKTWKFLDPYTASPVMIQQFKEILPAVDFDMYCDIQLSKALPSMKKFDWMNLQTLIDQIYVVAENRPANFRGYFTNTQSLNAFKLIAQTLHDLIESSGSCYKPDVYPQCTNFRDITRKIVFILSMVSLLDPSQLENATKFFDYSSESSEIALGMKDAILEALKFELPESGGALTAKNSAEIICVDDANDEDDDDTVVAEEGIMDIDDDDEDDDDDDEDEDEDDYETRTIDDGDHDEDDDDDGDEDNDVDMEEEEFSSEILEGGGEGFQNDGIVVEIPGDIRGIDLDRLLQDNDSSIADLALALSIQADERRPDPPISRLPIPSVPDTIESDKEQDENMPNTPAEVKASPSEDPIFSKERQRQFAIKLISQILTDDKNDVRIKYQLMLGALSKLNVNEPDELEVIESVLSSLVVKIKETKSLLYVVILSEFLRLNNDFTSIISQQINNHGIIDIFTCYIKDNVSVTPSNSQSKTKKSSEQEKTDQKPFIIPKEYSASNELGTVSAMLRLLEPLKERDALLQVPPMLLDLIIKVIVREEAPKWFINICKRFGLCFTQSAEKFKARLDRERLVKSFEKVQLYANNDSLDLSYSQLSELYEELKAIVEIAQKRPGSWQKFVENRPHIIELILNLPTNIECCNKDVIKLLEVIVSPVQIGTQKSRKQSESICEKRKRSKSQGSAKNSGENFVDKFLDSKRPSSLISHPLFVRKNLFSESESVRWAMHSLMKTLFSDCSDAKKPTLVKFLWTMFNSSIRFGQRAIQYTDLLGFFTIKSNIPSETLKGYGDLVAKTLNSQLTQLSTHSNSLLYSRLAEQLSFGGFYLESQLCLSCNTQNEEFTSSTITGLKGDTKYTTTAQIYKLKAGQEIQRVSMKLTDVKRTRHVKSMTLYYTTRTSIPIIELKNSPQLWLKAKTIQLSQGQSEVTFNLPVSIKANFLIIEFSSFYDESYSIPETLPCPRCSNNVHTDPGICGNCGENVFQCHKCRMINYDERDPYICTQCGFCRYAKFSLSMSSRNCTIADPVETEDERKRAEVELKKQLVKADATWEKLIVQRRELEDSCYEVENGGKEDCKKEAKPKAQLLVTKYNECKTSHNDITSMIRAANACRETLADYERRSNLNAVKSAPKITTENDSISMSNCYGCAVNGAENNLTLVRALCQITSVREALIADGAVEKLLSSPPNLGSSNLRKLIRRAICRLVRGSKEASKELGERLKEKIISLAKQNQSIARLDVILREDLELLKQSLKYRDSGWEYRIKAAMAIFLEASELCDNVSSGTTIVNGILLPCLAILKKQTTSQENNKESRTPSPYDVNFRKWADGDPDHQYETRTTARIDDDEEPSLKSVPESFWLPRLMFCKWSQEARIQACNVVSNLAKNRKTEIIDLMVSYFKYVNEAGEYAVEYLGLLRTLLVKEQELAPGLSSLLLKGLGELLMSQIDALMKQELEFSQMSTISSSTDLRVGKTLDAIVLLLYIIIDKSKDLPFKMIKPILRGYLSLCRVSLLRTKAIEDAQDGLLKLLETLTSGGEDIARDFVKICFRTLSHFSKDDFQASQFVFERLCNIIRPESTEDESFRVQIDKDPLQEEFLPGRMVNNPYPSSAVGETIRDLKNKICRDTELIAMVDDDTSLELLVSNKIVKLDLAVADVYKKIWLQNHETNVPMRVIYRMRGLMGEATEEFVETLPEDDQNEEEIFKRASYLAVDNGLDTVLDKLESIRSLNSRSRPLLGAGLKLLGFCVHLRVCRDALAENSSASMLNIMLQLLNICIEAKEAKLVEDILAIMNRVLAEAATHGQETETGHKHELTKLLKAIDSEFVQSRQNIVMSLMEMIPFLSFGDEQLMEQLINHFDSVLSNLSSFDESQDEQHNIYLECFCDILKGLKPDNPGGKHLKDLMYARNLPRQAIDYLRAKTPSDKNYASDEWKDLLERPVLPFILRILAGLATGHPECQKLIGEMVIPELHRLEQVAAGGIGTLAEEALEALRDNSDVFKRVSEARRATRKEKAKVGKSHRMKTLLKLGMAENTDGTIKADDRKSEKMKLDQAEDGPLCVICKEGCQFEPKKIMSIYCFCKRATVEPFEANSRKTVGFETVSSFNLIHNECHKKAVVAKRSRDEWETSFLHNNSTRCNALLPLWGPEVNESDFSTQMAKFNESVRDATGVSPDVTWLIHNIKLMLHRFSTNGKFYLDAGGGGPESNMKFLPHLIHYILYTTNTLKTQSSLKTPIQTFLDDFNVNSSWAVSGYFYKATSALIVFSKEEWIKCRVDFLKKMIICTHMREVSINPKKGVTEAERKELPFEKYKSTILFWFLIDQILDKLFDAQAISDSAGEEYTEKLQMFIRKNTVSLQKSCEKLVKTFNEEFIVVDSLEEFIDVASLYSVIEPSLVNDSISQIPEDTTTENLIN